MTEMVKAYVSIPMSGHDLRMQCDKAEMIRKAAQELMPEAIIITPFDVAGEQVSDISYADAMGKDVRELLSCRFIIAAEGWNESKGCRDEMFIALNHGIHPLIAVYREGRWDVEEFDTISMQAVWPPRPAGDNDGKESV